VPSLKENWTKLAANDALKSFSISKRLNGNSCHTAIKYYFILWIWCLFQRKYIIHLFTESEGQTGKYLAQGHDVRDQVQRDPYIMTESQVFSRLAQPNSIIKCKEDHCSYRCNFFSCKKKAWKKCRLEWDSDPWPLRYRCGALTNWVYEPTGSWSFTQFLINPWRMKMK